MIAIAEKYPIVSEDPGIQIEYEEIRRAGQSHKCAEMFALQQGPALDTDTTFTSGKGTLRDQFDGDEQGLQAVVTAAQRRGYTPNATDTYEPQLADFVGDPRAFVPYATGGKAHVAAVCKEKDLACHGKVEVKRERKPPPKEIPLAEDLVEQNARRAIEKNPDLAHGNMAELREEMIEKHGPIR